MTGPGGWPPPSGDPVDLPPPGAGPWGAPVTAERPRRRRERAAGLVALGVVVAGVATAAVVLRDDPPAPRPVAVPAVPSPTSPPPPGAPSASPSAVTAPSAAPGARDLPPAGRRTGDGDTGDPVVTGRPTLYDEPDGRYSVETDRFRTRYRVLAEDAGDRCPATLVDADLPGGCRGYDRVQAVTEDGRVTGELVVLLYGSAREAQAAAKALQGAAPRPVRPVGGTLVGTRVRTVDDETPYVEVASASTAPGVTGADEQAQDLVAGLSFVLVDAVVAERFR